MSRLADQIKSTITVAQYFKQYINPKINLEETPSICCPFHKEDTPSFSYSKEKKIWRCWGACKVGGDVINLHKKAYKLKTREDAIASLALLLKLDSDEVVLVEREVKTDEDLVEYRVAYAKALAIADKARTASWDIAATLELDYIMTQHKDRKELAEDLTEFINKWR